MESRVGEFKPIGRKSLSAADRRTFDQARPILLAAAGRRAPDAESVRGDPATACGAVGTRGVADTGGTAASGRKETRGSSVREIGCTRGHSGVGVLGRGRTGASRGRRERSGRSGWSIKVVRCILGSVGNTKRKFQVDHRWDNRRLADEDGGAGRRRRRHPRESHRRGPRRARWRMDLLFFRPARRLERGGLHRGCDVSLDPRLLTRSWGSNQSMTGVIAAGVRGVWQ